MTFYSRHEQEMNFGVFSNYYKMQKYIVYTLTRIKKKYLELEDGTVRAALGEFKIGTDQHGVSFCKSEKFWV